jgi:hypothetical protein
MLRVIQAKRLNALPIGRLSKVASVPTHSDNPPAPQARDAPDGKRCVQSNRRPRNDEPRDGHQRVREPRPQRCYRAASPRPTRARRPSLREPSRQSYWFGARWEAIFTTCVWSSVSHASTPMASASERPSLIAASCVGGISCGAFGMMLISCSRTAVGCETRTSPGFTFDND